MGGFFKRGEIVQIGANPKRWCIDVLREQTNRDGDTYVMAELSDLDGRKVFKETEHLVKVGG